MGGRDANLRLLLLVQPVLLLARVVKVARAAHGRVCGQRQGAPCGRAAAATGKLRRTTAQPGKCSSRNRDARSRQQQARGGRSRQACDERDEPRSSRCHCARGDLKMPTRRALSLVFQRTGGASVHVTYTPDRLRTLASYCSGLPAVNSTRLLVRIDLAREPLQLRGRPGGDAVVAVGGVRTVGVEHGLGLGLGLGLGSVVRIRVGVRVRVRVRLGLGLPRSPPRSRGCARRARRRARTHEGRSGAGAGGRAPGQGRGWGWDWGSD